MKKIVAISVMFALVAAAAFAQPTVGGQFKAGATLLWGTSEKDQKKDTSYATGQAFEGTTASQGAEGEKYEEIGKDWLAGGRYPGNGTEGFVNVKFGDAEMGGYVRAFAKTSGDYHSPGAFAFMWWRPSELFRIQIGHNPDADWGAANITGWGFNGEAQDFVALDNDSSDFRSWNGSSGLNKTDLETIRVARTTGFYGGIKSSHSVITSLYPIDGLTVNIGFPFGGATGGGDAGAAADIGRAADKWLRVHAQIKYDLEEVGSIYFTYEGQGQAQKQIKEVAKGFGSGTDALGDKLVQQVRRESIDSVNFGKTMPFSDDYGDPVYGIESPKLWLSFYGNKLVDGLTFDVGFGYQPTLQSGDTPPIQIGLGATYAVNEAFNIKLRAGAKLGEKKRGTFKAEEWERVTGAEIVDQYIGGKWIDPYDAVNADGTPKVQDKDAKWAALNGEDKLVKDDQLFDSWKTGTEIGFHILPSYKLSAFTVYLNAGIGLKFLPTDAGNPNRKFSAEEIQKRNLDLVDAKLNKQQDEADNKHPVVAGDPLSGELIKDYFYKPEATSTEITWYVNPYIRKSVNGASLMAGIKVWSSDAQKYAGGKEWVAFKDIDGKNTQLPIDDKGTLAWGAYKTTAWYNTINWSIPIGVNIYF